jgi:hypothetical protein
MVSTLDKHNESVGSKKYYTKKELRKVSLFFIADSREQTLKKSRLH